MSKYHVVRPSSHDCCFENLFEITLNILQFIFCPIWHDLQSVLYSCTKLQSFCSYISFIIYKQTLSNHMHFIKYHVVRPSINDHFWNFYFEIYWRTGSCIIHHFVIELWKQKEGLWLSHFF